MRFLLFLFLVCASGDPALAQDSWKVSLNGKRVLATSTEDREKNIIKLSPSALKKKGDLLVSFTENPRQKNWERFMAAVDENGNDVCKQHGNSLKIKSQTLQTLLQKSKTLQLYTWSLPKDPKLRASVRVRRIHLCTLVRE
jgi:hypothetical protein